MALSHRLRQIVDASLADLIEDWHDFDLMVGTAAATLVGLMFVAASIGASIYTEKNRPGMQAFISPTVVHFTSVLVLALFAPRVADTRRSAGAGRRRRRYLLGQPRTQLFVRRRFDVDIVDRLFYAAIPLLGYVLLLLAAFFLLRQSEAGLDLLAAAQITLLLAGIRNAWDMMMWIAIRVPTTEVGGRDGGD
jgi:hypothetical protein